MTLDWLTSFLPAPMGVSAVERLRGCLGALLGLLLTGLICTALAGGTPMLIAPLGASAVLLFTAPASPLAQPWSIIGGNTVSALIGVSCAQLIPDPLLAAPLGGALSIGAMFALRCLHPPGGAIALTAVLGGAGVTGAGYHFVLSPVLLDSLVLMLVAMAYNNATRRPYPHRQHSPRANPHQTEDRQPTRRIGVRDEDLDAVLQRYDGVLDVSRDELGTLIQQAEMEAYRRRFGEITCADIMSRDVVAVQPGTPLAEAWALLRRHDIRALPVVDDTRQVIGLVSDLDFMRNPALDLNNGLEARFRQFFRGLRVLYSERPEMVGQIMPRTYETVHEGMHVAELVPLMADAGMRHVPVVNGQGRLSGIIAQSDLIAALYRGSLVNAGAARQSRVA